MPRIKICGLKRECDVLWANECKPDFVGFVFAGSKRKITFEQAMEFREILDASILAVGVFVNEPVENVVKLVEQGAINLVQLHGDEDENYILWLRRRLEEIHKTSVKIIKAVRLANRECAMEAEKLSCDYLLYDTYVKDMYGGTGKKVNLSLLKELEEENVLHKPYFVAGGISAENLNEVIEATKSFCIDISSGVETDGYKDFQKMKEIVEMARGN